MSRPQALEELLDLPLVVAIQRGDDMSVEQINLGAREAAAPSLALSETLPRLERWLRGLAEAVRAGKPRVGVDDPVALDWSGEGTITTRYLTYVCVPLVGKAGGIDGAVTFAMDATVRLEARLHAGRGLAWFQAALDAIGTPVVLADPDTQRTIYANAYARQLSRAEAADASFTQAVGLNTGCYCTDRAGVRLAADELPAARAARGEVVDAMEVVWHTPSGRTAFLCFAEKVPAADEMPSVLLLSFFDITQLRSAEEQLRHLTAARDDFLLLVAHELRTPLTVLKLRSQIVRDQNAEMAGAAALDRAVARMEALVEQMLASTRILESGISMEADELELCEVIDEVIAQLDGDAKRAGSLLTRDGARELRGRWDRILVEQVVSNLLRNAIRFGAARPVRVECLDLGDHVSVAVSDSGVGIAPADHQRIFERFTRAVSSRNYGGLGLGLWLSKEMVSRMGGSIRVKSDVGQGAVFTLELPKWSDSGPSL